MKDVYFYIDVHPAHRCFLRFMVGCNHFQCRVLPFGIVITPRVFIKIFTVIAAHVRCCGLIIFPYLDDWLLVAKSHWEAYVLISLMLHILSSLEVSINTENICSHPMQSLNFIGATLNSVTARAYLFKDRFQTMNSITAYITNNP